MNSTLKKILQFVLFFSITILLFYLVYRGQDFRKIWRALLEADFRWVIFAAVMGILSHMSRARRWQLSLAPMGYKIGMGNSFMAVMVGYFANMLFPRLGEVMRCASLSRYEEVPLSKAMGSVLMERAIDVVMLLLMTLAAFVFQWPALVRFWNGNPDVQERALSIVGNGWLWAAVVAAVAVILFLWIRGKKSGNDKVRGFINGLKEGLLSVWHLPRKLPFILHSVFIWLMYYLMLYVVFFSFEGLSHLSPGAGLLVFVLSSFGMLAPTQGGIGAWHFMVIAALLVYIPNNPANVEMIKTFALLAHGSMMALYIVVGGACWLLLPLINRNKKRYNE